MNFEICGEASVDGIECISVVTYSHTGAEIWLYVSKETNELINAQRIDGEWNDLDIDEAKKQYAEILYCL